MINLSTALSPADLDDLAAAYTTAFTMVRGRMELVRGQAEFGAGGATGHRLGRVGGADYA